MGPSPPSPLKARAFIFIAKIFRHFLPSSTRVEFDAALKEKILNTLVPGTRYEFVAGRLGGVSGYPRAWYIWV